MKRIVVLGGLGPQATMDFERRVHDVSERLLPRSANTGYPPMTVLYYRGSPFAPSGDGDGPLRPLQPAAELLAAAAALGPLGDVLVVTANAPNLFRKELQLASGLPVLSMVDLAAAESARRSWRRAGILTFLEPTVYIEPLAAQGVACEVLPYDLQRRIDREVPLVQSGQRSLEGPLVVREALADFRVRGVDGCILGCTELALMLEEHECRGPGVINPLELLAEEAVRFAAGLSA